MSATGINPFELVITVSKDLEGLLESGWGAEGKGLHEKLNSIESRIPVDIQKRIRWLATIRNKVVHDSSFTLDEPERYELEYHRLKRDLLQLKAQMPNSQSGLQSQTKSPKTVVKEPIAAYSAGGKADAIMSAARMRNGSSAGFPALVWLGLVIVVFLLSNLIVALLAGFWLLVVFTAVRLLLWLLRRDNFGLVGWAIMWVVSLVMSPMLFIALI